MANTYRVLDEFLLRAPAVPYNLPFGPAAFKDHLGRAVLAAQPRLEAAIAAFIDSGTVGESDLVRLRAYHRRATQRCTPFGLLSILSLGRFGVSDVHELDVSTLSEHLASAATEVLTNRARAVTRAATGPVRLNRALLDVYTTSGRVLYGRPVAAHATIAITLAQIRTSLSAHPGESDPSPERIESSLAAWAFSGTITPESEDRGDPVGPGDSLDDRSRPKGSSTITVGNGSGLGLPLSAAKSIQRAASVLAALCPDESLSPELTEYHDRFLEAFDLDRLVPLSDLMHPTYGLGAPPGYRHPASERRGTTRSWASSGSLGQQDSKAPTGYTKFQRAYERAVSDRLTLVTIDEQMLDEFATEEERRTTVPPPVDLICDVLGSSDPEAAATSGLGAPLLLSAADHPGTAGFGAARNRFHGSYGPFGAIDLADVQDQYCDAGAELVAVAYVPTDPSMVDIAVCEPQVDRFIDLGGPGAGHLRIDAQDILIGSTRSGFVVLERTSGKRLIPISSSALFPRNAPNAARFLIETGLSAFRRWDPWGWMADYRYSPYLPRITLGDVVLRRRSWRVPNDVKYGLQKSRSVEGVRRWARDAGVPRRVVVGEWDRLLEIDLDDNEDGALLFRELTRTYGTEAWLSEALPRQAVLSSPRGRHFAQLVASVVPSKSIPREIYPSPISATRSHPIGWRGPFETQLSVHVYATFEAQRALLADAPLRHLLSAASPWYFLHYRDPEPHLRLRSAIGHADERISEIWRELRHLLAAMTDMGLVRRWYIDGYDPELERYGGSDHISAAETTFWRDSELALTRFEVTSEGWSALLDAAFAMTLTLGEFGDPPMGNTPQASRFDEEMHAATATVLRLIRSGRSSSQSDLARLDEGDQYRAAVRTYTGGLVARAVDPWQGFQGKRGVLASLLHMQANRRVGIDPIQEGRAIQIALRCHRALSTNQVRP